MCFSSPLSPKCVEEKHEFSLAKHAEIYFEAFHSFMDVLKIKPACCDSNLH